ncbi:restriction endonuclease subunit S [Paracoccus sp. TK19116]|uniref:Restriction endonuclease subunit S n=1 Tax=Paracoccus albicereus TaxID=2922394 RepID=A0ABT1MT13_9RHOB|nr:restriction endonuclease subunit S [Paracoccus albicereus]MCQ0971460.1 restriction endonuclease subunit S [Paracoccus albicereus]
MTEHLWEVPSSWEWTVIKVLGDIVSGATPSTKVRDYWDGDIIWFAPSDLTGYRQKFIARGAKTLTEEGLANSSARIMPAGSVMFSSRAPVGYVAINSVPAATNQGFKSVVPYTGIFNEYLYHYLKASKQMAEQRATGTTFKELSGAAFGVLPAPLPPTNEQRRIVEKIEAMFDEIDKGVESLQAARTTLSLYRQSLLKSAFEGRLTADWRAQNADKLEAPKTLLARIQHERDTRYKAALDAWQDALAQWRAYGEKGKKPAKPKRPRDIAAKATDIGIHGWTMMPLGLLIDEPAYGTSKKSDYDGGNKGVLRIPNIAAGVIDATDLKSSNFDEAELEQYQLIEGDVLTIRSNGSLSLVGKPALVRPVDTQFVYAGYLIRLRPIPGSLVPKNLVYLMMEPTVRGQIENKAKSTSGVNNINAKELQELQVPICSADEQSEIVRILDARLEAADALEAEIDAALTRADALRQSILKKAFSGHLVPQDPNDEPASALLERIKAEKAERDQAAKRDRKSAPPRTPKARRPTLTDLIEVLEEQKSWISAAKAAQELGIGDGSTSDDVEAFYLQLKDFVEDGAIDVERRGNEDWLRLAKTEVS